MTEEEILEMTGTASDLPPCVRHLPEAIHGLLEDLRAAKSALATARQEVMSRTLTVHAIEGQIRAKRKQAMDSILAANRRVRVREAG